MLVHRRRFALAIRLAQEVRKRIDRVAHPRGRPRPSAATIDRRAARQRTPVRLYRGLPEPGVPDRDRLLSQADAVLHGHLTAFGVPVAHEHLRPDWRRHPASGTTTPLVHFSVLPYAGHAIGGDVKYVWELSRHKEAVRLAQAHCLTGEARYASGAIALIESWMQANPPVLGINWVSTLEVALRSISWAWVWMLTSRFAWNAEVIGQLHWHLSEAARHIHRYDSIHHSPNTHLTGEALGLLYIATVFPELRGAARWRRRAIDILVTELPHQFLRDGFHYERATGYHRYNVECYLHALAIARRAGEAWGEAFVPHLTRALDATAAMRMPSGEWPVLGDEDGGCIAHLWATPPRDQGQLLALGAALLGRDDWLDGLQPEHCTLPWWFGLPLPEPRAAARRRSFALSAAGYFGATSAGSDGWYCAVDAGPHGGDQTGHAHTDLGHVEIALGDAHIVADPGCPIYAGDEARRNWCRSLAAHACVVVDGDELAQPHGPFGWTRVAPTPVVVTGDDGSTWWCRLRYPIPGHDVHHERQVVLVRDQGIHVVDFLLGRGIHEVRCRWPLAMRLEQDAIALDERELRVGSATLSWASSVPLAARLEASTRSPSFGRELDASAIVLASRTVPFPAVIVSSFQAAGVVAAHVGIREGIVEIRAGDGMTMQCAAGRSPHIVSTSAQAVS